VGQRAGVLGWTARLTVREAKKVKKSFDVSPEMVLNSTISHI